MSPRTLTQTLALTLFSLTVLGSAPASAKVFAPNGEGFSINMPGKPTATETTHKSFVGAVQETSYTLKSGSNTYTASVSNLPEAAVILGGAGTILGKAKEGLLKESGGTETAFTKTHFGKYEGRELSYTLASGGAALARLYLVEKRLYVIVGSGPATAAAAIQRFVTSFQLTSP